MWSNHQSLYRMHQLWCRNPLYQLWCRAASCGTGLFSPLFLLRFPVFNENRLQMRMQSRVQDGRAAESRLCCGAASRIVRPITPPPADGPTRSSSHIPVGRPLPSNAAQDLGATAPVVLALAPGCRSGMVNEVPVRPRCPTGAAAPPLIKFRRASANELRIA